MLPFGQLKKDGKGSKKPRQKLFLILHRTEDKKGNELRVVCTVLPDKFDQYNDSRKREKKCNMVAITNFKLKPI
jgi:hypothetical protein